MPRANNTSKPKKGFLNLLKEKISRSRPHSPVPSQASPQPDHTPPSSHVGTDEASESRSMLDGMAPRVDVSLANNRVTNSPRPSGDVSRVPVVVSPPNATSAVVEPTSENEEPPVQAGVSDEDIMNTVTLEVDPELEKLDALWAGLQNSLQALKEDPNMHSNLISSVEMLIPCLDGLKAMGRNQEESQDLTKELTALSELLGEHESGLASIPMSDALLSVIISIDHEVRAIKTVLDRNSTGDEEEKADQDEAMRHYRRIKALFQQLEINTNKSARSIPDESLANTRLERLDPVKQASYDSGLLPQLNRRNCTQGTRTSVLSGLDEWLNDPLSLSVYWISGTLGTGKTTIAYTFCQRTKERGKLLAASFFCTRDSEDCRDVSRIIPTIAYQLAHYSVPFRSALYSALGHNPEAGTRSIEKQFEQLLLEPIRQVKETLPDRLVVVIDALDECSNQNLIEVLLDLLFASAPTLPLKFLVTSRPETEIYTKMLAHRESRGAISLNDIDKSLVQQDLRLYLAQELEFMTPIEADINQLAERAGLSFTHAANLVKYAKSNTGAANPRERLRSLIDMSPEEQHTLVDPPYMKVVKKALDDDELEDDETEDIRVVLNTVLLAQEPINIETIGMLGGIGNLRRVETALHPLRSALHHSEKTGLVSTLDSAFPEIMFSEERSGTYFCDVSKHSELLARGCFLRMKEQLRFNICDLETSFVPDDKVENLQSRTRDMIPPALLYACRYWAIHFCAATGIENIFSILGEFLSYRLLFWMEVLNLRRELDMGVAGLLKAKERLEGTSSPPELITLLADAYHFARGFAECEASRSTPHLYISSLQLCPRSSMVYRIYSGYIKNWLKPLENGTVYRSAQGRTHKSWNIGSGTLSIAYSPDGTRIAVGCEDKAVSIYDANTGSRVGKPLEGHTEWVRCVVFSPGGAYILSASSDCTIRKWDASSGEAINASFEGHTHPVRSIAFSPDGSRVASGSWDNTVRIWNAEDGSPVMELPEEHKWGVNCVAFSINGLLASGGNDHAIRLWESAHDSLEASQITMNTVLHHTNGVMSIAFTPDGSRLVSGSLDCNIRVWSADGSLLKTFLQGCSHEIYSITVSPDGLYIASGSSDSTIQVWDIENGNLAAGPFLGHSSGVRAVAFSPNGTQLLSGSHDASIRAWDLAAEAKPAASNSTFHNQFPNGVITQGTTGRMPNRPGVRVAQEPEYHTRLIQILHQDKQVCPAFHNHAPISVTSSAWLLDGSNIAYLDDPGDNTTAALDDDGESTLNSDHIPTKKPSGSDGWLKNHNSQLLAWVPPTTDSCVLLPHLTSNSRIVSLLSGDERFIGNRWPGKGKRMAGAGQTAGQRTNVPVSKPV